jgi:hypothetical protein
VANGSNFGKPSCHQQEVPIPYYSIQTHALLHRLWQPVQTDFEEDIHTENIYVDDMRAGGQLVPSSCSRVSLTTIMIKDKKMDGSTRFCVNHCILVNFSEFIDMAASVVGRPALSVTKSCL